MFVTVTTFESKHLMKKSNKRFEVFSILWIYICGRNTFVYVFAGCKPLVS